MAWKIHNWKGRIAEIIKLMKPAMHALTQHKVITCMYYIMNRGLVQLKRVWCNSNAFDATHSAFELVRVRNGARKNYYTQHSEKTLILPFTDPFMRKIALIFGLSRSPYKTSQNYNMHPWKVLHISSTCRKWNIYQGRRARWRTQKHLDKI